MNADGFADLVAWNMDDDGVKFLAGPKGASSLQPRIGGSAGLPSAIGACVANSFGTGLPALTVWLATSSDPSATGTLTLAANPLNVPSGGTACEGDLPAPSGGVPSWLTFSPTATDVDGDGYDDLLVGQPAAGFNRAVLYFGGCPAQRLIELPGSMEIQVGGSFGGEAHPDAGYAVSIVGDLDGDGYPEIAVGNPYATLDSFGVGEVYIYKGGAAVDPTPTVVLRRPNATTPVADGFGAALD